MSVLGMSVYVGKEQGGGGEVVRRGGGSQESNPTIIAGWSGLASAGERKLIACDGAFQANPLKGLYGAHCAEFAHILAQRTNYSACDRGQRLKNALWLSHTDEKVCGLARETL